MKGPFRRDRRKAGSTIGLRAGFVCRLTAVSLPGAGDTRDPSKAHDSSTKRDAPCLGTILLDLTDTLIPKALNNGLSLFASSRRLTPVTLLKNILHL